VVGLHRTWSLLVAFSTAAIALGTVAVPVSASATTQQPRVQHPLKYVPLRGATARTPNDLVFNNMDYNGGPVMPSNTDYMVLWSPVGLGAYPAGYVNGVSQFFKDLAHDSGGHQNVDSVTAQYRDLTGTFARYATTFGGALVDAHPYPASQCPTNSPVTNCLTDAQIQSELERFVSARGLRKDLSHEYFLMTPPHVETCFSNDPNASYGGCSAGEVPSSLAFFCAYHQNTGISPFLIYANDPYVPGNPGCDDGNHPNGFWDGELSGGLSHEQNESVSDPIPNDAWTDGAGQFQGFEVGDVCVGQFGATLGTHNGAIYNQVINGHFYWFQEEWSNKGATCLQRLAPVGTMPTAKFTVSTGSALTLDFDATGSTAPGGVAEYVWQFNDTFGAQTVEQTTPTISHTFPSGGAYSIGLTIFAGNGLSTGTGAIVTTGHSGFSQGFTFAPANPIGGQKVSFSALTTVSAQPVLVYFWDFGDGTIGSGANPKHRYAAPGAYNVTLVMFSGVGSAFPGAGAGPITQRMVRVD
jgi:PKD domain